MMKYKKMDLAIEAFNQMKLPLKIVGRGVEYKNLKKMAGPTIEFLGRVSDEKLREIYSQARAFIFPQEEDFGIVAIEALASGRPVIAFRAGDIAENIKDGESGVLFERQTVSDIIEAVKRFEKMEFNPQKIRQSSLRFSKERFKREIKEFVEKAFEEKQKGKNFSRKSREKIGKKILAEN